MDIHREWALVPGPFGLQPGQVPLRDGDTFTSVLAELVGRAEWHLHRSLLFNLHFVRQMDGDAFQRKGLPEKIQAIAGDHNRRRGIEIFLDADERLDLRDA
jgi:hypothetical protein